MDTVIAKYHLHPIIDHFTIALLALGVLADVVGYVLKLYRLTISDSLYRPFFAG
jgi:uncharacterized membrane protein